MVALTFHRLYAHNLRRVNRNSRSHQILLPEGKTFGGEDKIPHHHFFLILAPIGEVDEVVPDNVVVEILGRHTFEVNVNHAFKNGVVVVRQLDVKPLRDMLLARDANVGRAIRV